MLHLHIRASGEANDERSNYIFISSFVASIASPFVALTLEAVFRTRVKGDKWRFALCVRRMRKQFFRKEIKAYECSCKWRDEARARMCKCGITNVKYRFFVKILILPSVTNLWAWYVVVRGLCVVESGERIVGNHKR